jgi:hypothetical protein
VVSALVTQSVDWLVPSPLWNFAAGAHREAAFFQPTLVELRDDAFMAAYYAASQHPDPTRLRDLVVHPDDHGVTKLFLPVHGRVYLVTASLCCRQPGFPDKVIDGGTGDAVFFVLRRRIDGEELAWVDEDGAKSWRTLEDAPRRVVPGEVRLPLASARAGNDRQVAFGYLPVSSSETYRVAPTDLADGPAPPFDLRIEELGARFTEPITGPTDPVSGMPDATQAAINQDPTRIPASVALLMSVYILLDGWEWFERYLPDVAAVIRGDPGATVGGGTEPAKQVLLAHLDSMILAGTLTLRQALAKVAANADALNVEGGVEGEAALTSLGFTAHYNLRGYSGAAAMLELLDKARAALPAEELPAVEFPKLSPRADAEYVVRLVYERGCDPPQHVVSLPSQEFRIAPFFDPEAPWPPIRIAMPGDVSVAAMRRATKNVGFMLSEALQKKMNALTGKEKALLKDEATLSDGFGIAFICSFSIQIIFIVAFFLLLIFVIVLNIAFWWMAFFKICLPIPKSLAPK